jgi:DHA1 family tetracycline resistance protein-like MFS transporter
MSMTTISASDALTTRPQPWSNWVEPWYLAYAVTGAAVAGLIPIMLPLAVSHSGGAADIGLMMASFNLGGLSAPLWGGIADRYRLHRALLVCGLLAIALGLAAFPAVSDRAIWLGLALLQGIGAAATATVANLFIVEAHPPAEWDARIGWLQTFYGGGQVAGLLIAGVLGQAHPSYALWIAAGLTAIAVLPAWLKTHTPPLLTSPRPILLHPACHAEWPPASPQRLYRYSSLKTLRGIGRVAGSHFALFLIAWLLSIGGGAAVFALYPVLMQQAYGVNSGVSALGFAIAAGLGLVLYAPAGRWSDRWNPGRVLQTGLALRLLAFLGLMLLPLSHLTVRGGLALVAFAVVVLAWSLLSVSSTAIVARLSPLGEGEGIGIFNSTTALAGVVGAALGGWIAGELGYNAVSVVALVGVALGLLQMGRLHEK